MAEYGQGMVRPGAWSVGSRLVQSQSTPPLAPPRGRQEITDPCDARYLPEIWSRRVIEATEQRLRWAAMAQGTQPTFFGTHAEFSQSFATSVNGFGCSTGVSMPMAGGEYFCQICTQAGVHTHVVPNEAKLLGRI